MFHFIAEVIEILDRCVFREIHFLFQLLSGDKWSHCSARNFATVGSFNPFPT